MNMKKLVLTAAIVMALGSAATAALAAVKTISGDATAAPTAGSAVTLPDQNSAPDDGAYFDQWVPGDDAGYDQPVSGGYWQDPADAGRFGGQGRLGGGMMYFRGGDGNVGYAAVGDKEFGRRHGCWAVVGGIAAAVTALLIWTILVLVIIILIKRLRKKE